MTKKEAGSQNKLVVTRGERERGKTGVGVKSYTLLGIK